MNWIRPIARILAVLLVFSLASPFVYAKDIKLGGDAKQGKLPPNMIVLPPIMVVIRAEDGGWKHIKIDAWLAGTDPDNAKKLDSLKNIIRDKADREFPNRNFEILQSARQGSDEAKKVIHAAVEAGLGKEWKGDVLIKDMLVY
jgi:hypothetical protein